MPVNILIRNETPQGQYAVHRVNCAAFDTDEEARLVDALRAGGFSEISLIAEVEGEVVGHILFSPLQIETPTGTIAALALAPMAIVPAWQSKGIGSQLVTTGITLARDRGHRIIVVLGHPDYYPRFGFSADLACPLKSPFSGDAWMALELVPGALSDVEGTVRYAEPFGITSVT